LFWGKEAPCIVSNTDSGLISSELLVSFLKKMDELKLLPRMDGLKPFLLLDGHGSRLELPFLQYLNSPDHEWVVCIGVLYGTFYWYPLTRNLCDHPEFSATKENECREKEVMGQATEALLLC
jgi:hypothetical protein